MQNILVSYSSSLHINLNNHRKMGLFVGNEAFEKHENNVSRNLLSK